MQKMFWLITIGIFCCGIPSLADDDLSFRTKVGVSYPLNKTWKIGGSEEVYYTDDGRLTTHQSDVGLEYSGLADGVTLGLNFRYIEENPGGDDWADENRLHFNVKINSTLWDIPWNNRLRLEFRDFEEKKDYWRLRNKLLIDMPFKIPVIKARPYVGDEVFFNLFENGFSQNRVYTGLKFKMMNNLKTDLYYYWGKSLKSGGWNEASVVGIDLIWEF